MWGHFGPSEVQKALKVGLVVMGFTCKLVSLCQEPSMCESFLMSLIVDVPSPTSSVPIFSLD